MSDEHKLAAEVESVLKEMGPFEVRVREGGGPESLAASLAVSVGKMKHEIARLESELVESKNEEHGAFCIYCGEAIVYRRNEDVRSVHERMLAHDAQCPRNPHVSSARRMREALVLHDGEIESVLSTVRYPLGPEDKLIAKYDLTWEDLGQLAGKTEWALVSKLSQCLLDMGGLCEVLAEKAALNDLRDQKAHAALSAPAPESKERQAIKELDAQARKDYERIFGEPAPEAKPAPEAVCETCEACDGNREVHMDDGTPCYESICNRATEPCPKCSGKARGEV